jgi:LPXTG-site transpeptidase (sortase) family protein
MFAKGEGELPIGIDIPSVGVKANVQNPSSTDIEDLDEALFKGAVRYPTSAKLGEEGNVLVFGHSSYLPIVHNQSFKAFNEISKLEEGAPIFIYSDGRRYTYAVESVEPANIENDAIPLAVDGAKLTLVTCNSFGDKTDRFIVTARLVNVTEGERPE